MEVAVAPAVGLADEDVAQAPEGVGPPHDEGHGRPRDVETSLDFLLFVVDPHQVDVRGQISRQLLAVRLQLRLHGPGHDDPERDPNDQGHQHHEVGQTRPEVAFATLQVEGPRKRARRNEEDDRCGANLAFDKREVEDPRQHRGGPVWAAAQDCHLPQRETRLPHHRLDAAHGQIVHADHVPDVRAAPEQAADELLLNSAGEKLQHPAQDDVVARAPPEALRTSP
mmetsp:Transcript_63016/g.184818  ORF Transcript_63016/g.184818 Transcript_63016/m.184818 type:complete len:225 (+) Transcript_63016:298-972(+)